MEVKLWMTPFCPSLVSNYASCSKGEGLYGSNPYPRRQGLRPRGSSRVLLRFMVWTKSVVGRTLPNTSPTLETRFLVLEMRDLGWNTTINCIHDAYGEKTMFVYVVDMTIFVTL